jgi:hypothetical protein
VQAGQQVGPADSTGTDYVGPFSSTPPAGNAAAHYSLVISTGDGAGYTVTGQGTNFTTGSQTIPLSALTVYDVLMGDTAWAPWTLTGSPQTIASKNSASGGSGDTWFFNDALQIPGNASNGNFSATLQYTAIGN